MKRIIQISLFCMYLVNAYSFANFDQQLAYAIKNGNYDLVVHAISHGANIEIKDQYLKATPLAWASYYGDYNIVEYLITRGANIEAKEGNGWTPLHNAVMKGYFDIAQLLITSGANINAKSNTQDTPLHMAVKGSYMDSNLEIVKLLLSNKANKDLRDSEGYTAHELAINYGKTNIANVIADYCW